MTPSEMLREMSIIADELKKQTVVEVQDDVKRTLELVCLHYRLKLLINQYSAEQSRRGRGRGVVAEV